MKEFQNIQTFHFVRKGTNKNFQRMLNFQIKLIISFSKVMDETA